MKINLAIATSGMEMMGLRKAWTLNAELAAMAQLSKREEFNKHLEDAKKKRRRRSVLKRETNRFNRAIRTEGKE